MSESDKVRIFNSKTGKWFREPSNGITGRKSGAHVYTRGAAESTRSYIDRENGWEIVPLAAPARRQGDDRFGVGDVLVVNEDSGDGRYAPGDRVRVTECDGDGFPGVRHVDGTGLTFYIYDGKCELAPPEDVPEKPQAFIVISDEGAGRNPVKYSTRGEAEDVASQAALVRPGVGFTVYQAVTVIKASKPEASVTVLDKAA